MFNNSKKNRAIVVTSVIYYEIYIYIYVFMKNTF